MSLRNRALGRTRGEWAPATLYLRDDIVTRLGIVYTAKTTFTTGTEFVAANWDRVSDPVPPPHSHPFDTTFGDARYPLRTDTDPYPQYLTEPEGRALVQAGANTFKSTSGAGLPAFGGRSTNDLHYDSSSKKEYILTGAAGTRVADTFTRANGALTTTAETGTYTFAQGSVASNKARSPVSGTDANGNALPLLLTKDVGTGAIEATVTFAASAARASQTPGISVGQTATGEIGSDGWRISIGTGGVDIIRPDATSFSIFDAALGLAEGQTATYSVSLSSDRKTVTFRKNGTVFSTITNYATAAAGNVALIFVANDTTGIITADDLDMFASGTLAWTSTDEFVAPHTHGSSDVSGGFQSTSSAGLPPLAGRKAFDLHFNETSGQEFIFLGALGISFTDNFNRADSDTLGAPWVENTTTAIIRNNRATGGTNAGRNGWTLVDLNGTEQTLALDWVAIYNYSYCEPAVRWEVSNGSLLSAYRSNVGNNGANKVQLNLYRFAANASATVATKDTALDHVVGRTYRVTLEAKGGVVTLAVTDTVTNQSDTVSYTDATPLTGDHAGFRINNDGDVVDNISLSDVGTARWASTDEYVAPHAHPTGFPTRQTATITTASLAAGAGESGTVALAAGYRLLHITADQACRVRLYTSAAKRDADVTRATTTDPAKGSGLMLDYSVTDTTGANEGLSPLVDGYVADATSTVAYQITNDTAAAAVVNVTLTWIRTE